MLNKEVCYKCWEHWISAERNFPVAFNYDGVFEARWGVDLIWCPVRAGSIHISRMSKDGSKVFGGNLATIDPVPEECPYVLEHTVQCK